MPSPLAALLRSVRYSVAAPRRWFREQPVARSFPAAVALVVAVGVLTSLGIVGVGMIADHTVDETVTVDNPDRPPEWVCEDGSGSTSAFESGCEEPERVEVDVGTELRSVIIGFAHYGVFGAVLWWVVAGTVLHVASRAVGGVGSFSASLTVAAWGLVPEIGRLLAGLVAIYVAFASADVTGESMEAVASALTASLAGAEAWLLPVSIVTVAVQWWILAAGTVERHDLAPPAAAVAAGIVAFLSLLVAIS